MALKLAASQDHHDLYRSSLKKTINDQSQLLDENIWHFPQLADVFNILPDSNFWLQRRKKSISLEISYQVANYLRSLNGEPVPIINLQTRGSSFTQCYDYNSLSRAVNLDAKDVRSWLKPFRKYKSSTIQIMLDIYSKNKSIVIENRFFDFTSYTGTLLLEMKCFLANILNQPAYRSFDQINHILFLMAFMRDLYKKYNINCLADTVVNPLEHNPFYDKYYNWIVENELASDQVVNKKKYPGPKMGALNALNNYLYIHKQNMLPVRKRDYILGDAIWRKSELPKLRRSVCALNLYKIKTKWLRDAAREFLLFKANSQGIKYSTAAGLLMRLIIFDTVLRETYASPKLEHITYHFIVNVFRNYGIKNNLARHQWFSDVVHFIHYCGAHLYEFGWPQLYISPDTFPRPLKKTSDYFYEGKEKATPDLVLNQMWDHLSKLDVTCRALLVIGRYCGYRRNELHTLPWNVLQDEDDLFYKMQVFQSKTDFNNVQLLKKDTHSTQLIVKVIREQKQWAMKKFGESTPYLFPSPDGGREAGYFPITPSWTTVRIQKWIDENNINEENGNLHHFKWHALRHHMGTQLALDGFDVWYIQSQLGHVTPQMTMGYIGKRIDLQKEALLSKGSGKYVDIEGNIFDKINEVETKIKKDVLLTTSVCGGQCILPAQLGEWCEHSHACLVCKYYRADISSLSYFKDEYRRLQETIVIQRKEIKELNTKELNRLAAITEKRLARNSKALEGCSNIIDSIISIGEYRGKKTKYRRSN